MRRTRSVALLGGTPMLAALLTFGETPARGQAAGTPAAPGTYAPALSRLPRLASPPPAPGDGVVPTSTAAMPAPPSPTIPPAATAPAAIAVPGAAPAATAAPDPSAPRSYFRASAPPTPPTRMERFRQRMKSLIRTDRDEAGNPNEHLPYDPSTGRSSLPAFSRPWLKPPG